MRVQVLGLCRFSYLSNLNGFQTVAPDLESQRAALYAPDRLARRLTWFEHVALPSLRAQGDPDFKVILLIGEDLPPDIRDRLRDLVADVPQITTRARPVGDHKAVCNEVMRAAREPDADWVAEFRIDDDDAVARDFVAQCRNRLRWLLPMLNGFDRAAMDFQRGLLATADGAGISYSPLVATYWAPALALYCRPGDPASVLDYPHNKVWWRMPTLTFSDRFMFVRGAHGDNDSAVGTRRTVPLPTPEDSLPAILADRFGIDAAGFAAAWDALRPSGG